MKLKKRVSKQKGETKSVTFYKYNDKNQLICKINRYRWTSSTFYKYDKNGNKIERIVKDKNGVIMNKTLYYYENNLLMKVENYQMKYKNRPYYFNIQEYKYFY